MDITAFIVAQRNKALLVGDYGSYRKQLSRRLLTVRKKLNYVSSKGRKYAPKAPITAEDIANNHEYYIKINRQLLAKQEIDSFIFSYCLPNELGPRQCT